MGSPKSTMITTIWSTKPVKHFIGWVGMMLCNIAEGTRIMWGRQGLDMAIADLATAYQAELDRDGKTSSYCPISMDHLHRIMAQMHRALDLNPDGPWYYVVCLAAVAIEIGQLSTTVRARVVEELSHSLKKMVDEYVLTREDADQVLNLVTRGFLRSESARSAEELAMYLAVYLADNVG